MKNKTGNRSLPISLCLKRIEEPNPKMKYGQSVLLFFISLIILPTATPLLAQQISSGIISPSRTTDWTKAGIPGGLPSATWTQCGPTIAPYSGSAATITSALASCGANHFVQLGAGTFNISSGTISFPIAGHVALRGMGANSTFLVFSGSAGNTGCANSIQSFVCGMSNDGGYSTGNPRFHNWTAGYTQGSNQITLDNVASISTTASANPTLLFLDQCEDGYTGSASSGTCTGSAVDNGNMFVCQDVYEGSTGCAIDGTDNASRPHRGQVQVVVATSISGSVVTLSSPIAAPNWRSGQNPQVWYIQSVGDVGVESLSMDGSASSTATCVSFQSAYQWWISGTKCVKPATYGSSVFQAAYGVVKDNYIFNTRGPDSYGTRLVIAGSTLVQNNIYQQVFAPIVFDGPDSGSVVAYNFDINNVYPSDFMRQAFFEHNINQFQLFEGNIANTQVDDNDHGTADMITVFRNFFTGWESCGNSQCGSATFKDSSTVASEIASFSRYQNLVGNVLGTPGFHSSYQNVNDHSIYGFGQQPVADPLVGSTMLRWANYDTFNNSVQCNNAEVPTNAPAYPNSIPTLGCGGGNLPASLYLTSKPAWFGSLPFPLIGPDVTNGNVGQCSGALNSPGHFSGVAATSGSQCTGTSLTVPAWGGHINANPAMACYLDAGGAPDGTGSVLAFDASVCYGGSLASPPPEAPIPPTNVSATVN